MTQEEKRERNRLYNKKYRERHPDRIKKSQELFDEKHPGRRKEISKKFRDTHKEKREDERKAYVNTKRGRASRLAMYYKRYDKIAGREDCTITQEWILENIFTSSCVYCGESDWRLLGCDRIDNSLPHTPENCVCSCGKCNVERGDRWSVDEFKRLKGSPGLDHPASSSM